MPNRLSQDKPQPPRLKVPEGHTIRWVPKNQPSETPPTPKASESKADPNEISPVEQAQLHVQRQRLAEGRSPAEPGEGFVPTGQTGHDAQTQAWLDEQRARFPREQSKE